MRDRTYFSRSLRRPLSVASTLAGLTIALPGFAATYEVGPGKPYADLESVADQLQPGDVVEVQGDATYSGGLTLTSSGTAAQKITWKGIRVNGKRPVLSGGSNTIEFQANHIVFEGFDVTGGSGRCVFHHGDDITIRDSVVHDCPGHGILGADEDSGSLTLDYVEVYAAGDGDTRHPIYIATDESAHPGSVFRMQHCFVHDGNGGNNVKTRAERNEIYYNWIEGAVYHELELIGPDGQDPGIAREDSDVVGNVFRKTNTTFVTRIGGDGTGDTSGRYRFVNNTFLLMQGSSAAFRLFDGIESLEAHNNVFYRVGGGGVQILNDGNVSWATGQELIVGSSNLLPPGSSSVPGGWTGNIEVADPGFTDLAGLDLRPAAGSPLIDAGATQLTGVPNHDFPSPLPAPLFLPPPGAIEALDGALQRPVDGAIDIGAFEFGVGGPGSSTSAGSGGGGSTSAGAGGGAGTGSGTGSGTGAGNGSGAGTGSGNGTGAGSGGAQGTGGSGSLGDDPSSPGSDSGCSTTVPTRSTSGFCLLALAAAAALVSRRRRSQ